MDPVTHFELPAKDRKRSATFYTKAFGWKTTQLGPEMGNYVIATTTETDKKGMIKTPGNINGGIYTATPDMGPCQPSVVIAVKDIKASMKKIAAAGGKVIGEPMPIPGVGSFVSFTDTEGNKLSILQPKDM